MKTIALIFMVLIAGCEYTPNNSNNPIKVTSDVPCITFAPITLNQFTYAGEASIYINSTGIGIRLDEVNADVVTIHLKASPVALNGNLAPGQFPIHISNPTFPLQLNYTWAELGIEPTNLVYVYLHFETAQGTAWGGNYKRQGKGQWYYWSVVDDCK